MTHLNHNNSGHTQLTRDFFSHKQLEKIFRNPRVHTSRGRHVGIQQQDDKRYDEDGNDDENDCDWEDDWDEKENKEETWDWDWDWDWSSS